MTDLDLLKYLSREYMIDLKFVNRDSDGDRVFRVTRQAACDSEPVYYVTIRNGNVKCLKVYNSYLCPGVTEVHIHG